MKYKHFFTLLLIAAVSVLVIGSFGCNKSSSSDSGSANGTTSVTVTPGTAQSAQLSTGSTNSLNFNFPSNAVSKATVVTLSSLPEDQLPQSVKWSANAGNIYVLGFSISTDQNITAFNVPITMNGELITGPSVTAGVTLVLAMLKSNTWVDVATITVYANGVFVQNLASTTLQGITAPGSYVLYKPAAGSSTAVSNLGIALIANDGYGTGALQVVHLYDAAGMPLATPSITKLDYSGAYDIDGQALTPDGSQGILVDGSNKVLFFSNVQTGLPTASTTSIDVSGYSGVGYDGDSVAIMPNGDEAVVSADGSSALLLVSGIVSGSPQAATTIPIPGARDGVMISNDGKTLLARGPSGLTVFSIAAITPVAGSLGGTVSHSFTKVLDMTTVATPPYEDGRNGMFISPVDSSRAVIVGYSSGNVIQLLTNLGTTPAVASTVTITSASSVKSVTITPNGKTAIVGTSGGILMFNGVDTGTLTQVGTLFAPTYTSATGSKTVGTVTTLGVTLDGLYAVICDSSSSYGGSSNGSLLVIPITTTGFSAPVGILNGIAVPDNDQMVIH